MIQPLNHIGLKPVQDYKVNESEKCLVSLNPKAYDAARAIGLRLDKPSETAGICETTVYSDPSLNNYAYGAPYTPPIIKGRNINQGYNINNAQIQYYVDSDLAVPYYSPVYFMPNWSVRDDYVDPMGSWKPHYPQHIQRPYDYACLSWINDSAFQREDITARQQAVHNQQRSEPFFTQSYDNL